MYNSHIMSRALDLRTGDGSISLLPSYKKRERASKNDKNICHNTFSMQKPAQPIMLSQQMSIMLSQQDMRARHAIFRTLQHHMIYFEPFPAEWKC